MNWQPVESSQIQAIGYEPEAEYPLGILFKPSKRQTAAGQRGSIYEYANVSPEMFNEFVSAESKGKYFERHIKKYPEVFTYRKVYAAVDLGPVNTATDEL